jgi:hypothetical protein
MIRIEVCSRFQGPEQLVQGAHDPVATAGAGVTALDSRREDA